jgi:hypothetical protein
MEKVSPDRYLSSMAIPTCLDFLKLPELRSEVDVGSVCDSMLVTDFRSDRERRSVVKDAPVTSIAIPSSEGTSGGRTKDA